MRKVVALVSYVCFMRLLFSCKLPIHMSNEFTQSVSQSLKFLVFPFTFINFNDNDYQEIEIEI